jgi:glutathione S-transferase
MDAMAAQKISFYGHGISPFASRVALMLRAKGLNFEMPYPPGGLTSETYTAINPLQKLPVLSLENGEALPESQVICDYLEDVYPEPALRPKDALTRAKMNLLIRIGDLYLMNPMLPLFKNLNPATRNAPVVEASLAQIDKGLVALNKYIAPGPFAIGDRFTLADCALAPILFYANRFLRLFDRKEALAAQVNVIAYYNAIQDDVHVAEVLDGMKEGLDAMRPAKKKPDEAAS